MLSDERLREIAGALRDFPGAGSPVYYLCVDEVRDMAAELLSRRAAEQPVAWQWQMIEGEANLWFVTNDADIAEKQRRDGRKLVPLFASPQPPVPAGVSEEQVERALAVFLKLGVPNTKLARFDMRAALEAALLNGGSNGR